MQRDPVYWAPDGRFRADCVTFSMSARHRIHSSAEMPLLRLKRGSVKGTTNARIGLLIDVE